MVRPSRPMPKLEIIDPGWSYSHRYTFSPAVRKGHLLFISGLTATDEGGKNEPPPSPSLRSGRGNREPQTHPPSVSSPLSGESHDERTG
jgi:hypothetical protein